MLDERKFAVLRAIVTDYVATQEPVGSKALVERHQLGVSPATVRNDMAALEDEGYIAQPHTSAGRIPTDRGYRLFVDNLSAVKPLSAAERRAIESFLSGAVDLDDVVGRTVRLLAQLTRQVAVVRYPSLSVSTVRHIETVPLSTTRLMLVLITSNGRVDQSVVEVPAGLDDGALAELRRRVNDSAAGRRLADAVVDIASLTESVPPEQRALFAVVAAGLTDVLLAQREERVVMGGAANLAAFGPDLGVTVQPVLEALEEQVVLLHLLGDSDAGDEVTVRIGAEQPEAKLRSTSVVSTHYGAGDSAARLGVIGPTRMDYPATMAAVGAVARYVSRILAEA